MPKASAPSAPCVLVWLSPQTTVLPGWVSPSSGPMMCTMPRRRVAQPQELDAEGGAVDLELADLAGGGLDGDGRAAEDLLRARGGGVVHGGEGQLRPPHLQPPLAQHREGLRRGDLVNEMQVDVEDGRGVGGFRRHLVAAPHLLEQRLRGGKPSTAPRSTPLPGPRAPRAPRSSRERVPACASSMRLMTSRNARVLDSTMLVLTLEPR